MGEGNAPDGVQASVARRGVRSIRRRVSRASSGATRGRQTLLLPVQADTLLGAAVRLRADTSDMLKGTRDGILKKVQPVSIHGQVSWDVYFTDVEDPEGQVTVARVGPEAVMGHNLEPGDRIEVEYLVGVAVRVTRLVPAS